MDNAPDDTLDSVLIGGKEKRTIEILDYDEEWATRFAAMSTLISSALGTQLLLSIDHIGSTSVPGLAAKPIIDILVIVPDVDDESTFVPQLVDSGLELRAREPGHRLLRTPNRDVHVHVLSPGSTEIQDYLDLRDWLRVSSDDRELYAATKRRLATQDWADMNLYADAKTDVVTLILEHARAWRAAQ
ncbi:GrpB family protein [Leifsonia sp. A12D58]|uniref:GrpB family protein n=1 Tax=Leifsonia sp. A12D58 TaxID=3397674 RepID=UPI0039E04EA7